MSSLARSVQRTLSSTRAFCTYRPGNDYGRPDIPERRKKALQPIFDAKQPTLFLGGKIDDNEFRYLRHEKGVDIAKAANIPQALTRPTNDWSSRRTVVLGASTIVSPNDPCNLVVGWAYGNLRSGNPAFAAVIEGACGAHGKAQIAAAVAHPALETEQPALFEALKKREDAMALGDSRVYYDHPDLRAIQWLDIAKDCRFYKYTPKTELVEMDIGKFVKPLKWLANLKWLEEKFPAFVRVPKSG